MLLQHLAWDYRRNRSSDNKFQIGEQTWAGQSIIQLPDLFLLKATVQINEVDISKINKNLKVEIRPDAFSDASSLEVLTLLQTSAINKDRSSKIKFSPVEILLNETNKTCFLALP